MGTEGKGREGQWFHLSNVIHSQLEPLPPPFGQLICHTIRKRCSTKHHHHHQSSLLIPFRIPIRSIFTSFSLVWIQQCTPLICALSPSYITHYQPNCFACSRSGQLFEFSLFSISHHHPLRMLMCWLRVPILRDVVLFSFLFLFLLFCFHSTILPADSWKTRRQSVSQSVSQLGTRRCPEGRNQIILSFSSPLCIFDWGIDVHTVLPSSLNDS